MKHLRKPLCLLAALAMAVSLLAGPALAEATNPQNIHEPVDMGGQTITLSYNWDIIPPNTDYVLPDDATFEQKHWMENLKRIEEKYNVKIQYINTPYDQIAERLTTSVLAGDPFCDLLNLGGDMLIPAVRNGEILALEPIAPKNADIFNARVASYPSFLFNGAHYTIRDNNVPIGAAYIVYNRDITDKLGLGDPQELAADGQWTWDKFMEIAKAATQDTNGDGVADQWGWGGTPGRHLPQWVASNDGQMYDAETMTWGMTDAKALEALEFLDRIYSVEKVAYVHNDDVNDYGGNDSAFREGNVAMSYAELWMMPTGEPRLPYRQGAVSFPKGPANTSGKLWTSSDVGGIVVVNGTPNPTWAVTIIEELNAWWGDDFGRKSDGTYMWIESMWSTEEDVDYLVDLSTDGGVINLWGLIPGLPTGDMLNDVLVNSMTPAQAVETHRQVAQDAINQALK
ncbi:MAG: extracellular solute-binding protein [Clostridiales bacterium]|nr:extracellular solute-binding protein [Clostridiales bacterium]